jgi:two-component system cell cycle sensor histidine kinase/response regulator CckA
MSAGTILLVEDNPITRKMLRVVLEIEGYDVADSPDGKTALELAAVRRPDLLIFDYVLPDTDGLQLLAQVRGKVGAPEVPAIILTGMVSRLEELRARTGASTHFLAKPVEPSQLIEVVRAQLAPAAGRARGQRILVVDDEPLNLKLGTVRLRRAGYEVETASGGKEALGLARHRRPDAILSDVMMPSMDGFTFCREVRRDAALGSVPVILVSSAYVDEADRELARQMGAHALVVRSPDMRDALAAIEAALRGTVGAAPPPTSDDVTALHRERLQVQLERQTARNETLLRQAAIQATALSLIRGLSEVLAQPRDVAQILGDVLVHCLDAAGLSTGLLYIAEPSGEHRLQALFGIPADRKTDAEALFGHPQLVRRIVESRKPVALSARGEKADSAIRDFLGRVGHPSVLIVPFVVLGETFGELLLASDSHDLSESTWVGFACNLALQFGQTVALGQSLKRLAASESRYRALMEHANDAIYVLDPQGTILEANQQSETLLGLPRDRVIGQHVSAFTPVAPGETPEYLVRVQQVLAAGGGHVDNVGLRRGDGSLVQVDFSISLNTIDGQATVLSIGRDVTERNRAATALRQAQERLHHVVSHSPAVLYSLRPEGDRFVATWISENVERLLGYTAEDVLPADWWPSRLHPEDRDRAVAEMAGILASGYVEHEYRVRGKDGEYRWLRAEVRLLRDASGHPVEAVGSWSDVSARKDAELKLQQSEEQYRLLFDSNPHPMWAYDEETLRCLAVNDAALRHYGYTRDEFLAMTALDIRPPEDVADFRNEYAAHRAEHDRAPFHSAHPFRHRKKDGTVVEVDVAANSIVFDGRAAWLLLATDVTEKRNLEKQLARAQKMEAVGQLAGGVAHDFNNLLGVITGYSELLMREVPPESRERKRGEEIKRAADRAAALTRQLLAFSRRQVLQPKVLDLNDVVAEVEKMMRRLITENIQIVTVAAPKLGKVRADAGQIEQVLVNLAINARDAMPSGGRLTIETANVELDETYVRANPEAHAGSYVMLAVADTGHGMDAKTISRIFEPFFTTKEDGKGTGLGLASVYGIVRQSGGTVTVYSEPGRGTTFKVYLPRVEAAGAPEPRVEPAAPAGGTETILLVEDADSLRLLVRELLENAGYVVLDAETPDKALSLAQSIPGPIHLVLTDMVMPRMNGQELARGLVTLKPEARVVFMSGYTDQAFGDQGTLEPGTHFLQKPFTMDALLRTIRQALDAGLATNDPAAS